MGGVEVLSGTPEPISMPLGGDTLWNRIFARTAANGECIEWTGPTNNKGYASMRDPRNERPAGTHRIVYEIANNTNVPKGMVVMHRCDNRKCLNPDHLDMGTYAENTQDMFLKERSGRQKLSARQVQEIRNKFVRTGPRASNTKELAQEYGIASVTVQQIASGHSWRST